MSLKGGARRDKHLEQDRVGRRRGHNKDRQAGDVDSDSYSDQYGDHTDDSYKRPGRHRNNDRRDYATRYDSDIQDSEGSTRTSPSSRHGYHGDRRFSRSRGEKRRSPPGREGNRTSSPRDRHKRLQSDGNFRTDSPSRVNNRNDSSRRYKRDNPSSIRDRVNSSSYKHTNHRDSPPSKRYDLKRSPDDARSYNRHYSTPEKYLYQSDSSLERYEDPWDIPSNRRRVSPADGRGDRRRINRCERNSSSDRSENSLDISPSRRSDGKHSPVYKRNSPIGRDDEEQKSPSGRYKDPPERVNNKLFSAKDKASNNLHHTSRYEPMSDKVKELESSPFDDRTFANVSPPQDKRPHKYDSSETQQLQDKHDKLGPVIYKPVSWNQPEISHSSNRENTSLPSKDLKMKVEEPSVGKQEEAEFIYGQDENEERGNWSGKFDFILSMLGYAVGLGNVWRFPYLCYRNGGGAFLFPFLLMMAIIGLPVFYLEAALGQFSSCGAMTCWHFAPLFKGLGVAMVAVSGLTSVYYNMIIGWSLHYMFSSFTSDLPFASCKNKWNTENCKLKLPVTACEKGTKSEDGRCLDESDKEIGLWNKTLFTEVTGRALQSPSQEYWERSVLKFSDGIEHYGLPKWDLVLCLLLAWVICFLCLIKGIKTTGKVVYFTALFPYVVLIILLFRGITLTNADIGIKYFITPNFERLADASVWKDAANQVFFSMSIAGGGLITLSSYNRFHNNILRDSIIVAVGDAGTCILGGFVIFSYLGYIAGQLQVNIEDVAADGAGLAFVVYPEAVSNLPPPTLWAILFFVMLLTLGLDSQFAMVETVLTGMLDQYPKLRPRKTFVILVICIILFILGLPITCPGGMYLLQLMDNYVGGMTLIIIGFVEIIALVFIYGVNRFSKDIHLMTGSTRFLFWKVTWYVLSPLSIAFIFIFMFVDYKASKYDKYTYPAWADVIGWLMTITCVIPIPVFMVFMISREKEGKNLWQKICLLCLPTVYWGPALKKHRVLVDYVDGFQVDPFKGLQPRTSFVNYAFDNSTEISTQSENPVPLGVSHISIISTASKDTAASTKSGMTYESNV